jgi:hypothetical protein
MNNAVMPEPTRQTWVLVAIGVATALLGLGIGFVLPRPTLPSVPSLPPASSSVQVLRGNPDVVLAVRNLARLESAGFHMERVIDLSERQSKLFGLIATEDAILLVAVADVTAGVDLGKLGEKDVRVSADGRRATIELPPAEVFHSTLDNERTYVHTRRTGLLAERKETLETQARKEAERALTAAALEAGILKKADENAKKVVMELARSLGIAEVEIATRAPLPASE